MKVGNYELRKPWVKYVDITIDKELYAAIRKSVLDDLLIEMGEAAYRVQENDLTVTKRKEKKQKGEPYKGHAYCVKCKEKRSFTGVIKESDSGRQMAQGKCPECSTTMTRILGKAE